MTGVLPEPLNLLLQQLSMGSPGPGGARRGLLVDGLLSQGLSEGQGALLHDWDSAHRFWISGWDAQQCCDRWLGWTACDWPDLTLSWEITEWWSGDQGEECVDRVRSERAGQAGHCCWHQGSPDARAWETQPPHTDPHLHLHTRGCNGRNGHRTVTRLLPSDS